MSDVTVKIGGDASGVKDAMKRTREYVKSAGEGLSPFLGVSLGTMGVGLFAQGIASALEKMKEIETGSKRLKMTAEEFQILGEAAEDAGLGIEDVGGAFVKMRREAAMGGKVFGALGLDPKEVVSGGQLEVFGKVAKAIMSMKDATLQEAAANEIFGRSYADMLPFMERYSELIADAKTKTRLTNDEVRRGAEDSRNVKDFFGAWTTQMAKGLSFAIDLGKADARFIKGGFSALSSASQGDFSGAGSEAQKTLNDILILLGGIQQKIPGEDTGGR